MPFHMYADDTQLYGSSVPSQVPHLMTDVKKCIEDVKDWMTTNMLKMNEEKTEIVLCSTGSKLNSLDVDHIYIGSG